MADSKEHIAAAVHALQDAETVLEDTGPSTVALCNLARAHAAIAQAKALDLIAAATCIRVSKDRVRV